MAAGATDALNSLLRERGHRVCVPTLTGLGERSHLFRSDLTLSDHVTDILQVIRHEDLEDFVLVGHSYGGMVISVVADRIPRPIRAVVYVDRSYPGTASASWTTDRFRGWRACGRGLGIIRGHQASFC